METPKYLHGHLPVTYRIEIYENSFGNDPSASFEATTPFMSVSVGDYIDYRSWMDGGQPERIPEKGEAFRVKAISHIIGRIKDSHNIHSMSICVEIAPYPR